MMKTATFPSIFRCSIFLDAHILFICSASKKALRLILKKNSCFQVNEILAHSEMNFMY